MMRRIGWSLRQSIGCAAVVVLVGQVTAAVAQSTSPLGDLQAVDREAALKDVPPGYMLIHDDIQVRIVDYERRGAFIETYSWPGGQVPYEFDANVGAADRITFDSAIAQWESTSSVRFSRCPNDSCSGDHIHIRSSDGNNSSVGRQGGEQIINIVSWGSVFRQAHELGHALGLWHEQSRSDRDDYVTINWSHIESDKVNNFEIAGGSIYGPYDFDSVMHYPRDAFSTDGNDTITVKPAYSRWQASIGQRDHLSEFDQVSMSACMYRDSHWTVVDGASKAFVPLGTCALPMKTVADGAAGTSDGGTLWIMPSTYAAAPVSSRPMVWRAPAGGVVIR